MQVRVDPSPLAISPALLEILRVAVSGYEGVIEAGLSIHLRDPGYSPETGGFHPVEIGLTATGKLLYITDFAYVGRQPYVELAKSLDFDLQNQVFQQAGMEFPLRKGAALYKLWERNFLAYYNMGIYRVSVQAL